MAPDLFARVRRAFPTDHVQALALLAAADGALPLADAATTVRVQRCAVHLAAGDLGRLAEALDLARREWRDVVVAAEYSPGLDRLRDLGQPFADRGP